MGVTDQGIPYSSTNDPSDDPGQSKARAIAIDDLILPATQERMILHTSTPMMAQQTAGVYLPGVNGEKGEEGGLNSVEGQSIPFVGLKKADYEVAGKTPKLRLRAQILTNGTAPGITITPSLRPITSVGATGNHFLVLGSALGAVAIATPAANAELYFSGAQFDFPADGLYTTGLLTSGTLAEFAKAIIAVQLMISYV